MIFIIVLIILILDQTAKFLATKFLILDQPVAIIKNIFSLTLIHNTGAAFGIFKDQGMLFIVISIIAIILICSTLKRNRHLKLYCFSLSLILAGAIGNLIDWIFRGYVVDFLDFRIWPVFNIADSAITVGAILLGYSIICTPKSAEYVRLQFILMALL